MDNEERIKAMLRPGWSVYLLLSQPFLIYGHGVTDTIESETRTPEGDAIDVTKAYSCAMRKADDPQQFKAQNYIGSTNNILRRFREHNTGKARATRGRKWALVAIAYVPSQRIARHVEQWFKCGDTVAKRQSFLRLWERYSNPETVGAIVARRVLELRPLEDKEAVE